ncbi:MAG TPA: nitrilase-related carbon-nitrogen hydrolase [Streptosporangiaceae bacterium]|jgi:predicted amidohydrolase|nr:nitrilase-related carbon-nitrogen hydrolase [Streptosporangiaceae bacterium]
MTDALPQAGTVVVACCQLAPVLADPAANRELAAGAVAQAAASGASVILLPELLSSGYVFESPAEAQASAEATDGETITLWQRLSAEHHAVIVGGFCEKADGGPYNSAALIDHGELRCVYRKAHLWDAERLWFTPGDAAPPLVPTEVGLLSVMICYDLEFPEWVRLPALAGAQLLCAPVNWPAAPASRHPDGERAAEVIRVQADAGVNRMFIAACDRTGTERGVDWVAGSIVVDPDGWLLAEAPHAEATILAECRLVDALDKRVAALSDIHADRRPELYRQVASPAQTS